MFVQRKSKCPFSLDVYYTNRAAFHNLELLSISSVPAYRGDHRVSLNIINHCLQ